MVTIKVTSGGEAVPIEAHEDMRQANDEQVLSFVNETLNKTLTLNDFQIERTAEGILVHPAPTFG